MSKMNIVVCGAGGFIESHLIKRLKQASHWVRGVDIKYPEFCQTAADKFRIADPSRQDACAHVFDREMDAVYQLAADIEYPIWKY